MGVSEEQPGRSPFLRYPGYVAVFTHAAFCRAGSWPARWTKSWYGSATGWWCSWSAANLSLLWVSARHTTPANAFDKFSTTVPAGRNEPHDVVHDDADDELQQRDESCDDDANA